MNRLRIYIEGDARLRPGFARLLGELRDLRRTSGGSLDTILCGSRGDAFDYFRKALSTHPECFNILLVDSETPVADLDEPWKHLREREGDGWEQPAGTENANCHFMVSTMECWFFADLETLDAYFKHDRGGSNPIRKKSVNTDMITKAEAAEELDRLSRLRFHKPYHKITHGASLLEKLAPAKLKENARSFRRLHETITAALT